MRISFEEPKTAHDAITEAAALAQALLEITVLQRALMELVPLDEQLEITERSMCWQYDFERTPDGELKSITATPRPDKLDS